MGPCRILKFYCFYIFPRVAPNGGAGNGFCVLEGDVVFPGRSCVVGPLGQVLVEGDDQERLLVAEVDMREVRTARRYLPVYKDRRPEVYRVE